MSDKDIFELDPEVHAERWEALVGKINAEAAPILQARRRAASLSSTLSTWRRPIMTASVSLVAAAIGALILLPADRTGDDESTLADAVLPWSLAAWMDGSHTPTFEELVEAVEEYTP